MRTERIAEPCPECGSPYLWRVTSSRGAVTLECAHCRYWLRESEARLPSGRHGQSAVVTLDTDELTVATLDVAELTVAVLPGAVTLTIGMAPA